MTRFGLGFAPDSWDSLIRAMAQKGFEKRDLLDAGLAVSNKKGGIYDRFRGRVMFPIIDLRGGCDWLRRPGAGGWNPQVFKLSRHAGVQQEPQPLRLNLAKNTKQGRLLLTEGYMDTISLHQAGFDCAVASLGTSLTADHAKAPVPVYQGGYPLLRRGHGGGPSGQPGHPHAGKNGPEGAGPSITGAKDPDEFIKTFGREAFARLLDRSENYVAYNLKQLQASFSLEDPLQRSEFARAGQNCWRSWTAP